MFSKPFRAVFYILAQAFMTLYKLPADWEPSDEHEEFTGADMAGRKPDESHVHTGTDQNGDTITQTTTIHYADQPDAGTALPDTRTNVAAVAFTEGSEAAAAFSGVGPVYQMTEKAGGFSRETYLNTPGWTDALLISEGMMVDASPKSVAPPPAPPATPPIASAPVAAVSAPAPTTVPPAPAQPGSVELDSEGYPWDQRIHSGGRTVTGKGVWQKRKAVNAALIAQVQAELRQNPPKQAAPAPFVPLQAAPAPAAQPAAAAAPAPAPAPRPPATAGEAVAQVHAAIAAAAGAPSTFQELMAWASPNGYGVTFQATAAAMGLNNFGELAKPENAGRIAEAHTIMKSLKA